MFYTRALTNYVREKQLRLVIYPDSFYGLGMEEELEFYQTTPPLQRGQKHKNIPQCLCH
jgi:hypothetical protein